MNANKKTHFSLFTENILHARKINTEDSSKVSRFLNEMKSFDLRMNASINPIYLLRNVGFFRFGSVRNNSTLVVVQLFENCSWSIISVLENRIAHVDVHLLFILLHKYFHQL